MKLTAEQVRVAVYVNSIHADCADADWHAIADELNETLGLSIDINDALALLDEIREEDRISYDDYSQLFDVIAAISDGKCENVGDPTDFCCSECGVRLYTETTDGYTMIEADEHTIIKQPKYCPNCGKAVKR